MCRKVISSIESWYPTHQYSNQRTRCELMSWRMIYGILFWGYCFGFLFFSLFCFDFQLSFFFSFWRPKFICFSLGLWILSMALSWVHLDPLKLFSSWKGLHAEIILGWSKSCFKKFLLGYMSFYNKTGQDYQGSGKMVRVKMSSAASSQITWWTSRIP